MAGETTAADSYKGLPVSQATCLIYDKVAIFLNPGELKAEKREEKAGLRRMTPEYCIRSAMVSRVRWFCLTLYSH